MPGNGLYHFEVPTARLLAGLAYEGRDYLDAYAVRNIAAAQRERGRQTWRQRPRWRPRPVRDARRTSARRRLRKGEELADAASRATRRKNARATSTCRACSAEGREQCMAGLVSGAPSTPACASARSRRSSRPSSSTARQTGVRVACVRVPPPSSTVPSLCVTLAGAVACCHVITAVTLSDARSGDGLARRTPSARRVPTRAVQRPCSTQTASSDGVQILRGSTTLALPLAGAWPTPASRPCARVDRAFHFGGRNPAAAADAASGNYSADAVAQRGDGGAAIGAPPNGGPTTRLAPARIAVHMSRARPPERNQKEPVQLGVHRQSPSGPRRACTHDLLERGRRSPLPLERCSPRSARWSRLRARPSLDTGVRAHHLGRQAR